MSQSSLATNPILLSWIAVNNDPFERERGKSTYRLENGEPIPGPTLTLLFDDESEYKGKIKEIIFLHRKSEKTGHARESDAVEETTTELKKRDPNLRIHFEPWAGDDPTDHQGIFEFLQDKMPELRRRFAGREFLIHISPGTPSMQTIWVLMAETGFFEPPFHLVKSYRKNERRGRPAVVPVELGIDTFYKVYKSSRPVHVSSEDQRVEWDPGKFQTERMRNLFIEARRFAHLNVPILLLGERGTGKTTLANWIRLHSPFRQETQDDHWPAVACGQYSPETMRAELFGYKKGAFTGATQDKEGLLSAANGDTLFLDEVGDVSRDLQRLLIKALEEKQYLPLGGDKPRSSDFRLLTATNLDVDELKSRLDPDFLDRISLVTLRLPPLREIREELSWLWETAYRLASARSKVAKKRATLGSEHHRRVVNALKEHLLPGNIRDLFRIAYRILAARSDPHVPLDPYESVEYGLLALSTELDRTPLEMNPAQAVAHAFSQATPLDALFDKVGRIPTKQTEQDLRRFLAEEIRRVAKQRGVPVNELCDVSDRTIREWANQKTGNTAVRRKNASEY